MSERLPFHLPTDFPIASEKIVVETRKNWNARTAALTRKDMTTKDPHIEELIHYMLFYSPQETLCRVNGIIFVWRILHTQSPFLPPVSDKLYDIRSETDPQEKILENPYLMGLLSGLSHPDTEAAREFKSGAMGVYELKVEAFKKTREGFRLH